MNNSYIALDVCRFRAILRVLPEEGRSLQTNILGRNAQSVDGSAAMLMSRHRYRRPK
ncbi:hypothetical protein [Burkholderia sp. Nafp2/4-1b]|uniref:hypothetical protein n=1 Tax=Burkholderia sp. Nafp2/4-1b TaxID=2116686 RepID=UPI0013CEC8CA|nr:hypothetical protein [Burkholderia sp. Nafp2/4-1b]